jgi:hypothetical protein
MSYTIYSLQVEPGEASTTAFETIMRRDDRTEGDALDPAKEARKRSIANALTTVPGLGYLVIEHDWGGLAKTEGVTPDEARRLVRHLQLDNGTLLVEIDDEHAAVKVPCASSLLERDIAGEVFGTLAILRDEAHLVPYDPQLGRELDLESDGEAFRESFARKVEEAREAGAEDEVGALRRAPWWKRLLRIG